MRGKEAVSLQMEPYGELVRYTTFKSRDSDISFSCTKCFSVRKANKTEELNILYQKQSVLIPSENKTHFTTK